jgi:hypothetical protein
VGVYFSLLFLFTFARAETNLRDLIVQPQRPTVVQLLNYASSDFAEEEFQSLKGQKYYFDWQHWQTQLQQHGPEFIAMLECAFPSATWAFVGRDTAMLADLAEAFYLSVGQKDRVVRLGISRGALDGLNDASIVTYLQSKGLSLSRRPARPFILVDTVSRGGAVGGSHLSGRQGRRLLDAGYNQFVAIGGRPKDLLERFNMIGLTVSTFAGEYYPVENVSEHLQTEKFRYESERMNSGFLVQHRIPTWNDPGDRFLEAGYDHFTGAWHGPFQKIESGNEVPGPETNSIQRHDILVMQAKIAKLMVGDNFLNRVIVAAAKRGKRLDFKHDKKYDLHFERRDCDAILTGR